MTESLPPTDGSTAEGLIETADAAVGAEMATWDFKIVKVGGDPDVLNNDWVMCHVRAGTEAEAEDRARRYLIRNYEDRYRFYGSKCLVVLPVGISYPMHPETGDPTVFSWYVVLKPTAS